MAVKVPPVVQPTVAAFVPRAMREEVTRQLGEWARLRWCESSEELVPQLPTMELDAVMIGLQDENGRSVAPTVVEIVARRPSLPILLYDRIDGATLGPLFAVFGVGLRMECVVHPFDRMETVLRRVLSPDYRPGVAPLLLHRFVSRAPKSLRLFLAIAALAATERHRVHEIARRSGVSLRTIERRLARARWPAARVVVQSFEALDAVWLMSEYGWSARRVQLARRHPHPSSVTRLLARYARVRPVTLREDGGFPAALESVALVLSPRGTSALDTGGD